MFPQRPFVLASALLLATPLLHAQSAAPADVLRHFHASAATTQQLTLPRDLPESFSVRVRLGTTTRNLVLAKRDVRSPGFTLMVADETGVRAAAKPATITYRGYVEGTTTSVVAATLEAGKLDALISIGTSETWVVQPYGATHAVFRTTSLLPMPGVHCGNGPFVPPLHRNGGGVGPATTKTAEIAIDADFDFYNRNGSNVTATQNAVVRVMNAVDAIYLRDVTITYKVTQILVRTSRVYSGSISQRLSQFRSRWNSSHTSIRRDTAHLFTGEGSFRGTIGVAWVGVICRLSQAYGASKAYNSRLDVNAGLVAHELGHNWGSGHCSGGDCRIMCAGLGGCARDITRFGQASKNIITSFKNSRSCLSDPGPPVLTSLRPSNVMAFQGGPVTLTGSRLSGVTSVTVGNRPALYRIDSDTQITISAIQASTLGTVQLRASNTTGASNALSLTVVETDPPKLATPLAAFVNFPATFDFGAKKDSIALLLWNGDGSTVNVFQSTVLSPLIVQAFTLNAAGVGKLSFTPSPVFRGLRLWSQIVALKGSTFVGASNIGATTFF